MRQGIRRSRFEPGARCTCSCAGGLWQLAVAAVGVQRHEGRLATQERGAAAPVHALGWAQLVTEPHGLRIEHSADREERCAPRRLRTASRRVVHTQLKKYRGLCPRSPTGTGLSRRGMLGEGKSRKTSSNSSSGDVECDDCGERKAGLHCAPLPPSHRPSSCGGHLQACV